MCLFPLGEPLGAATAPRSTREYAVRRLLSWGQLTQVLRHQLLVDALLGAAQVREEALSVVDVLAVGSERPTRARSEGSGGHLHINTCPKVRQATNKACATQGRRRQVNQMTRG